MMLTFTTTFYGGYTHLAYYLFGFAIIYASLIISNKRSVYQLILLVVIFLLFTLSTALIYLLLDFYFLGLAYIIVYCGAIAIIFLFVIMMVQLPQMAVSININNGWLYRWPILAVTMPMPILIIATGNGGSTINIIYPLIITYVYPVVTSLIFTSTSYDIFNLGSLIYVAYPISILLIAVSLWIVMVGIIQMLIHIIILR